MYVSPTKLSAFTPVKVKSSVVLDAPLEQCWRVVRAWGRQVSVILQKPVLLWQIRRTCRETRGPNYLTDERSEPPGRVSL